MEKRWEITDKALNELATIVDKLFGDIEYTREDLDEVGQFLLFLTDYGIRRRRARLSVMAGLVFTPEGYPISAGYPGVCEVCGEHRNLWVDATGIKCSDCYRAFKGRQVPRIAATDRDSWYSVEDLEKYFGIGNRKAAKLAEDRTLNARKVHGSGFLLFMEKDNPGMFPSRKSLREAEERIGSGWQEHQEFRKQLEGFSIMDSGQPSERRKKGGACTLPGRGNRVTRNQRKENH